MSREYSNQLFEKYKTGEVGERSYYHLLENLLKGFKDSQVLDKWLKDRKGRVLSTDDQLHFRKVIASLSETIKLQSQTDSLYSKVEKSSAK